MVMGKMRNSDGEQDELMVRMWMMRRMIDKHIYSLMILSFKTVLYVDS